MLVLVYLYANLEKHVPTAQTLDAESNLRAQDRMKQLARDPRLIEPGHDTCGDYVVSAQQPEVARIE